MFAFPVTPEVSGVDMSAAIAAMVACVVVLKESINWLHP